MHAQSLFLLAQLKRDDEPAGVISTCAGRELLLHQALGGLHHTIRRVPHDENPSALAEVEPSTEPAAGTLQPSTMNANTIAQAGVSKAVSQPPVLLAKPEQAGFAHMGGTSQRLPVWEERARKMGFPPSAR